jgi:hypothetical protein
MPPHTRLRLEPLEVRRAPAVIAADHRTVTFTDADGDTATVTFSLPVLTDANKDAVFIFNTPFGTVGPQQLRTINLAATGLPGGLSVTVAAVTPTGDPSTVDVGWVKADGKDVGTIKIGGDLGRVTAGDGTTQTPGLRGLVVGSLGLRDPAATQEPGGSVASVVTGALGRLNVTGPVHWASVTADGGARPADGRIGSVRIGSSLEADPNVADTGLVRATGAIGPVTIGGGVKGGNFANSGVRAGGNIGPVTITGDVLGEAGPDSAAIRTTGGNIGPVKITGNLTGGAGIGSAAIVATVGPTGTGGKIAAVTITGDVTGVGADSAAISAAGAIGPVHVGSLTGAGDRSGSITAGTGIGPVTVDRDVTGGAGTLSAAVTAGTGIGPVRIGESVTGSTGSWGASLRAKTGNLGPVRVGGELTGGVGDYSAAVFAYADPGKKAGRVAAVTVYGDVTGGVGDFSASVNVPNGALGPVNLLPNGLDDGDLTGGVGKLSASLHGRTVARVTIAGSVAGGTGPNGASILADRTIGPVAVGGDWTGASIAAGVDPGADGYFGDGGDAETFAGSIAGITITGTVSGSAAVGDNFAFTARWVKSLKVHGTTVALMTGPANDPTPTPLGATGDFVVSELP